MKRIAKFHKVSKDQFVKDWIDTFPEAGEEEVIKLYDNIEYPKRATKGSAGYDFFSPMSFTLAPGESIKIPTGIKTEISDGWVLNVIQGVVWVLNIAYNLIIL